MSSDETGHRGLAAETQKRTNAFTNPSDAGGGFQRERFFDGWNVGQSEDVIAAVVVGGTSLMGGEGKIFGTLIGAFIIAVMKNGLNLMNVGAPDQQIVLGAVVTVAVLVDTMKRRGET